MPEDDKRVEPPIPEAPPKNKETAEQQVAAENAESKRVEPPVPVAPPADSNKKPVPKEVSNENKRVESSAQIDSVAAANKPAAAASPSSKPLVSPLPPKDSVKPDSGAAIETVKKEPQLAPPVAQKSLSNGEKRLLNEQKDIIQKMRGAKNQNAKLSAVKAMEDKVDSKKEPSLDKRAPQSVVGEVKKVNAAPVIKNEVQREQKKMPLPLLVHSNAKGEDVNHAGESPKREILENVAPDREKRDLYYVTEGYQENQPGGDGSKANVSLEAATDLKPAGVKPHKDRSVAKQEATELKQTNEEPHKYVNVAKQRAAQSKPARMEPHKDVSVAKQKDKAADENLTCEKDSKSKASSTDTKVVSQELSPDSNPAESVAKKVAEPPGIKEKERVYLRKDDEFPAELVSRSHEQKKTANTADDNKSDGLVIAPSKLSNPIVRLPESVSIDEKLKPAVLNVMKPMSRELKTVEDKPETNKKK